MVKLPGGKVALLIAQSGDTEVGNGILQALDIAGELIDTQYLKALDIIFRGLNIPAIGEIAAASLADDGNALSDVELGAVMAAVAGGQQQAVHLAIQNGQVFIQILHIIYSFFSPGGRA